MTEAEDEAEDWRCTNCGSENPHGAITFPRTDEFEDEIEVDVTCESVYVVPVDGGHGFVFTHDEFEAVVEHFLTSRHKYTEAE